jgi:hypothetical protein
MHQDQTPDNVRNGLVVIRRVVKERFHAPLISQLITSLPHLLRTLSVPEPKPIRPPSSLEIHKMSRNFIPALLAIGVGVFTGMFAPSRARSISKTRFSNPEFSDLQATTPSNRLSSNYNTRRQTRTVSLLLCQIFLLQNRKPMLPLLRATPLRQQPRDSELGCSVALAF